jgi:hypothetical protein
MNPDVLWRKMYFTKPPCPKVALYHNYGSHKYNLIEIIGDYDGIRYGYLFHRLEHCAPKIAQLWMDTKLEGAKRQELCIKTANFQDLKSKSLFRT